MTVGRKEARARVYAATRYKLRPDLLHMLGLPTNGESIASA